MVQQGNNMNKEEKLTKEQTRDIWFQSYLMFKYLKPHPISKLQPKRNKKARMFWNNGTYYKEETKAAVKQAFLNNGKEQLAKFGIGI